MVLFRRPLWPFPRRKGNVLGNTIIIYGESDISVSKEVADFLENDRKRQAAEARSDRRHTSKSDSETVPTTARQLAFSDPTWNAVLKNLCFKKLQMIIAELTDNERFLLQRYFFEKYTLEQIGYEFGISKMAVSKRLKKLLSQMRRLMET